jgi:hypothetical protein
LGISCIIVLSWMLQLEEREAKERRGRKKKKRETNIKVVF